MGVVIHVVYTGGKYPFKNNQDWAEGRFNSDNGLTEKRLEPFISYFISKNPDDRPTADVMRKDCLVLKFMFLMDF